MYCFSRCRASVASYKTRYQYFSRSTTRLFLVVLLKIMESPVLYEMIDARQRLKTNTFFSYFKIGQFYIQSKVPRQQNTMSYSIAVNQEVIHWCIDHQHSHLRSLISPLSRWALHWSTLCEDGLGNFLNCLSSVCPGYSNWHLQLMRSTL